MKRTVKRMVTIATSAMVMASMLTGITAHAAVTYKTLTYSAGNVDGIVGSAEVTMEKVINTTFDAAAASRLSRKGYTVASWNVPSTGETVALGAQYKMPASDLTFVANWKAAEYNVSFAGKGGKTADGKANLTGKATFGTAMKLPECEFIYNGYTFAGWKYDNKVYAAGEDFEVPALLSGSKIVFSATWSTGEAPATTKATTAATTTTTTTTTTKATTAETTTKATTTTKAATSATTKATTTTTTTTVEETTATTTTTTTTAAVVTTTEETTTFAETTENVSVETPTVSEDSEVKTFDINAEIDYTNDSNKMYQVALDEIRSYGTPESISINLKAQDGNIGQLVMGIGGNVNGTWKQVDYNEMINSENYTINFADGECSNLDGEFLQIGYWYGSSSLYIDSITVEYLAKEEDTAPVSENVIIDYNNDGVTDRNDAEALRKYIVGVAVEGFDINEENADVNGDGSVNVFDYMTLSRMCG